MACPTSCNDITLLSNPTTNSCSTSRRERILTKISFMPCSIALPSPLSGAIGALFTSGDIVASMPLANIVFNDPTLSEFQMDETSPNTRKIDTREVTFEDRFSVSKDLHTSPVTTDSYWDYTFWQNKIDVQTALSYMLIYSNGDVIIPKDANGQFLKASLLVYLAYNKPNNAGGSWVEYKKGSIIFQGDPLNMAHAKPAFNYIEEGISL